ncbi:Transcriptional regulator SplA [Lentibacillus sp. JNUCC-1]|uniref:transcriptional regulator SplA domain-containing protein n=1 Tax=Lentibacillus sp. JNUCC-1 TaxID=2654513 RepID=UPI0012E8F28B|nr:transcriptional regulator SplA domain-containing protein [Lentibacillus sp. JNUCC-1]MUV36464.1 Transcriptional regulator SplA [Lentibacillus sp. JNUCC-1]
MEINQSFQPGEVVYIIIRNPHAQDVAHVQQAAVVQDPESHTGLSLFIHETYFPLTEEFAVYQTEEEAEQAYQEAFDSPDTGGETYYG